MVEWGGAPAAAQRSGDTAGRLLAAARVGRRADGWKGQGVSVRFKGGARDLGRACPGRKGRRGWRDYGAAVARRDTRKVRDDRRARGRSETGAGALRARGAGWAAREGEGWAAGSGWSARARRRSWVAGWAAAALGPSWVGFGLHIGFGFLVLGWAGFLFYFFSYSN